MSYRLPTSQHMFYHLVGQVWHLKLCNSSHYFAICSKDSYLGLMRIQWMATWLFHTIQKFQGSYYLDSLGSPVLFWHPWYCPSCCFTLYSHTLFTETRLVLLSSFGPLNFIHREVKLRQFFYIITWASTLYGYFIFILHCFILGVDRLGIPFHRDIFMCWQFSNNFILWDLCN